MEGVAGQAVTDHFCVDLGTARLCVLQFFQNDDARTLAHDEAVTIGVIGPRGLLGIVVVLCRERLAGGESCERYPTDRRFRTTGHHHVRIPERDQPAGVADRMRAGRAGRHDGMVGTPQLVADGNLTGCEIDQPAGNEERGNTPRALVAQGVPASTIPSSPPMPEPIRTPVEIWSSSLSGFQPASASAMSAAAIA